MAHRRDQLSNMSVAVQVGEHLAPPVNAVQRPDGRHWHVSVAIEPVVSRVDSWVYFQAWWGRTATCTLFLRGPRPLLDRAHIIRHSSVNGER